MRTEPRHILMMHTAIDPRTCIPRLHDIGFRFTLMKKEPTAEDRACFERVITWDYEERLDETLTRVRNLNAEDPIHGVMSFSESGVIISSLIAADLGLRGNPPRAALRARNKYLMRRSLEAGGLAVPAFHLVRTVEEIREHLGREGRPMVLKPISGSSSYGVTRLEPASRPDVIEAHLHAARTYIGTYRELNPQYPFEFWLPSAGHGIPSEDVCDPERDFLLEGFIEGQQVSVDGLVSGDAVTCLGVIEIERIRDSEYFLEYEEWMPSRLGRAREAEIQAVTARAVRALGLTRCCFHCELKVGPEAITVLEIAARRGADNISDFLHRLMGVDIYEEGVRLAAGEHRFYEGLEPRGAMKMRYFLPVTSGILVSVEGEEAVRSDPRVSELDLEFSPGDEILAPPLGYEFLGYISVLDKTPAAAAEALEAVYPQVRFHIAPSPSLVTKASDLELQAR